MVQAGWKPALLFFALASSLQAQTPRPSEQLLHFTVFSAKPVTGLAFTPRSKAAPTPLVFYPTARSPRYEYRGAMPLRFKDVGTGAVVAEAVVPADIHEALLLLSPIEASPSPGKVATDSGKPTGDLKFRIAVLDEGASHHAAGQLEIVNFSGLKLQGKINGRDVALQEGLNLPQAVGHALAITLHATVKGRAFQSYVANVQLKRNERALLILFPPFYKGSVEVQSRLLVDEPLTAPVAGR